MLNNYGNLHYLFPYVSIRHIPVRKNIYERFYLGSHNILLLPTGLACWLEYKYMKRMQL